MYALSLKRVLIAQTADRRPRQVGKIARPKVRRFRGPLTLFKERLIYEQSAARTLREQQEKRPCV